MQVPGGVPGKSQQAGSNPDKSGNFHQPWTKRSITMNINLTEPEREYLLEILRDSLGTLHEQIYHSTTSTFTDMLKGKEALLNEIIRKAATGDRASVSA